MIEIEIKSKKHLLKILKDMISDKQTVKKLSSLLNEKDLPKDITYSEEILTPSIESKELKVSKPTKSINLKKKPTSKKKPLNKKK
jgi:hypothetical protein